LLIEIFDSFVHWERFMFKILTSIKIGKSSAGVQIAGDKAVQRL
jgi:hypothetical protein